jgi:glyoxylase-like metal-dependent hydrolase (beta-lactamase superfamily II)
MKELFPGIYQIPLTLQGFAPGSVNAYLVREKDQCTLIDTGWDYPVSVKSMRNQLEEVGIHFTDIKRIFITHCHGDHLGMMEKFQKESHAVVYLHHKEMDIIKVRYSKEKDYWPKVDRFLQEHGLPPSQLTSPPPLVSSLETIPAPDVWLQGTETIPIGDYTFKIVHTPGHTPGHMSLFEPRTGILISGDVLLPTIVTNAATHVMNMTNPLQQYFNSLQTLKELDIKTVLPGHEYPFTNHRGRIEEILEHYRKKTEGVLKVFTSNNRMYTAFDMSKLLSWSIKTRTLLWDQLGDWDKRLAVLQTIALMEELVSADRLTRFSQDGKLYYRYREMSPPQGDSHTDQNSRTDS